MKKFIWVFWAILTIALGSYFFQKLFVSDDKDVFLIGETTYGHYQIEMDCASCHTDPFGGPEILQDACVNCHGEELEAAHDSHPKKKFTDPREAYRLKIIDARYCVSCHTEHHKERTLEMGLTLPDDYCYHCHEDIGEERESHKGLAFDSCASSGCHNFHDNRALYEAFLVENAGQPWLKEIAHIAAADGAAKVASKYIKEAHPFNDKQALHPQISTEFHASSHAMTGMTCGGCHADKDSPEKWIDKPNVEQCGSCHAQEKASFAQGKHGMRLALNSSDIPLVTPRESNLEFKNRSLDVQHGCNSCHLSHTFDTTFAKVDACLTCHNDEHSKSFKNSPHGKLWLQTRSDSHQTGSEVSCATCHLPRVEKNFNGIRGLFVDHNQNNNLRPNEKMIRSVCMDCHGLEFSIDALADPNLIRNNFNGKPGIHIESVDWSLEREKR